jgi:hypothetical protein
MPLHPDSFVSATSTARIQAAVARKQTLKDLLSRRYQHQYFPCVPTQLSILYALFNEISESVLPIA